MLDIEMESGAAMVGDSERDSLVWSGRCDFNLSEGTDGLWEFVSSECSRRVVSSLVAWLRVASYVSVISFPRVHQSVLDALYFRVGSTCNCGNILRTQYVALSKRLLDALRRFNWLGTIACFV